MIFEEFIKKANIGYPDIFTNLLQRKFRGGKQSFCGAALSKLLDYSLDFNSLNEDSYVDILRFANAAANISTTCYGAVPSMPESETIESVLMNNSIKVTKIV